MCNHDVTVMQALASCTQVLARTPYPHAFLGLRTSLILTNFLERGLRTHTHIHTHALTQTQRNTWMRTLAPKRKACFMQGIWLAAPWVALSSLLSPPHLRGHALALTPALTPTHTHPHIYSTYTHIIPTYTHTYIRTYTHSTHTPHTNKHSYRLSCPPFLSVFR